MAEYHSDKDIKLMIEKYVAGTATDEEIKFIESYYAYQEQNEASKLSDEETEDLRNSTFNRINDQIKNTSAHKTGLGKLYKYAAVAAVLFLASAVAYLIVKDDTGLKNPSVAVHKVLDIGPGSNKAVLTLGDGTKIILNNKADNKSRELAGIRAKIQNGQLIYLHADDLNKTTHISANTVATPKGGQYQIILPDGTKVWLNAASSLTYPELFIGNKRTVKLQGEGYFEVAKNKAMPFHVETADQDVEVTGTHFNINSYGDNRSTNTTLLEGSVNVSSLGIVKTLVPGQQALVYTNPTVIKVKTVDTDEEIAWKNGLFQFDNTGLKNILSQLERWYDVKVNYTKIPSKRYNGMISRSANLSEVLKMLELTGNIKFRIEENRELRVSSN